MRQLPVLGCQLPVASDFVVCSNPAPSRRQHPHEPFMTIRLTDEQCCKLYLYRRRMKQIGLWLNGEAEAGSAPPEFTVETATFHYLRSYLAKKYPRLPLSRIHQKTIIILACEWFPEESFEVPA